MYYLSSYIKIIYIWLYPIVLGMRHYIRQRRPFFFREMGKYEIMKNS